MKEKSSLKLLRKIDELTPHLVRFLQELIRSKSVTGDEGKEAQPLVKSEMKEMGLRTESWVVSKSDFGSFSDWVSNEEFNNYRMNVIGTTRGRSSRNAILAFNGHVDVVPAGPGWKHNPFGGELRDKKVFGRGACDMKGGLAASLFAVKALLESGLYEQSPKRGIMIQSVCGEESGGIGTLSAVMRGKVAEETIVSEPTNLQIAAAQCGCLDFKIKIKGKAAHGANRDHGVSAFEKFLPVFNELIRLESDRNKARKHHLFKGVDNVVPLSVGKVKAGDWDSTVPEQLIAEGRYGVWPGEELDSARSEFEHAVSRASKSDPWLARNLPQIEWLKPEWESAEIPVDSKLVLDLKQAFKIATKQDPTLGGETGGTDMRLITNIAQKPAVIFGPGDPLLAHFKDEYLEVKQLVKACKTYAMFALGRISN